MVHVTREPIISSLKLLVGIVLCNKVKHAPTIQNATLVLVHQMELVLKSQEVPLVCLMKLEPTHVPLQDNVIILRHSVPMVTVNVRTKWVSPATTPLLTIMTTTKTAV